MKNSTVRNGKSRSKISSVGVGQPNARRKMPIVTSIAIPASTPAATPTRRTARKDRVAVDLTVVFMGSSCSDAIVAFGWIGKLVAIPRRRAGFSLRCGQRALIEILHEVFREKDIQRPIDR